MSLKKILVNMYNAGSFLRIALKDKRWLCPLFSKVNIVGSFPAIPLPTYPAKLWKRNTLLLQLDPKGAPDIPVGNSDMNVRETGEGTPATDTGATAAKE